MEIVQDREALERVRAAGARGLSRDRLEVVVAGLASAADPCDLDTTRHNGRDYRRLLSTDLFDVWLIAWGPSSFLGLHDHGGSSGAIVVVTGSLVEISTDLGSRAPLRTVHLTTGAMRSFGPLHVHEVWNPNGVTAVSVHAYSPPLNAMSFFDE